MNREGVRVRCPGCGHIQVVELAVGQQLQCDTCSTTYFAPIVAPDELPVGGEDSGAFELRSEPASPQEADDPAAEAASAPPTQRAGVAGPGRDRAAANEPAEAQPARDGVQQTHSWPQIDVRTGQVVGPSSVPDDSDDSDLSDTESSHPGPSAEATSAAGPVTTGALDAGDQATDEAAEPTEPRRRSRQRNLWPALSVISAGAMMTVAAIIVYILLNRFVVVDNASSDDSGDAGAAATGQRVLWADAPRESQRMGSVQAKVVVARYGAVRARDKRNHMITTDDDRLLAITIQVRNTGSKTRPFHNWYHHQFQDSQGRELLAELRDDRGRGYTLLTFEDVTHIEGQRLTDRIDPDQSAQDTLVFQVPGNVNRKALKEFRLTLPAAAIESIGAFYFRIPASMVQGL